MWLQWAWGLAGVFAFFGAIAYVLCIFWPYLRWTRAMMVRSFELALRTANLLATIQERIGPLIDAIETLVNRIKRILDEIEPELGIEQKWVDPITGKGRAVTSSSAKPGKLGKIIGGLERIIKWLDPATDPEPTNGSDELAEDDPIALRIKENKKRRKNVSR